MASVATLVRWFTGATPESRNTDPYIASETLFLVGVSAVALFLFLLLMTISTPIFVYVLFEVALTKYLPKGWPIFEEGFLFIDNIRYELLY